eukprot:14159115-Ditylum_brightwellii.AAC.1
MGPCPTFDTQHPQNKEGQNLCLTVNQGAQRTGQQDQQRLGATVEKKVSAFLEKRVTSQWGAQKGFEGSTNPAVNHHHLVSWEHQEHVHQELRQIRGTH